MKTKFTGLVFLSLFLTSWSVKSQVVMWSDTFVNSVNPTPTQITAWTTFISQIDLTKCFAKMKISGTYNTTGISCTDPVIIRDFATAMVNGTAYISTTTGGHVWSICNRYFGEVWLDPPSSCSGSNCPNGYIIRPGIGNINWGGVNTATCGGANQRMTFTFEYAVDNISDSICEGDSILFGGVYRKTPGLYTYTYNTGSCDSTINLTLNVDSLPVVTLNQFADDTVCNNGGLINLPAHMPLLGGVFTGNGISGSKFDPQLAGNGSHWIVYSYTDSAGCSSADSSRITVVNCVGINEVKTQKGLRIYPNPGKGMFEISLKTDHNGPMKLNIYDLNGKIVRFEVIVPGSPMKVDLNELKAGSYFIELKTDSERFTEILMIQ